MVDGQFAKFMILSKQQPNVRNISHCAACLTRDKAASNSLNAQREDIACNNFGVELKVCEF